MEADVIRDTSVEDDMIKRDWEVGDIAYTFATGTQRVSKDQMYPVEIIHVIPLDVDHEQHYVIGVDTHVGWYSDYRSVHWLYESPEQWEEEQTVLAERRKELISKMRDTK